MILVGANNVSLFRRDFAHRNSHPHSCTALFQPFFSPPGVVILQVGKLLTILFYLSLISLIASLLHVNLFSFSETKEQLAQSAKLVFNALKDGLGGERRITTFITYFRILVAKKKRQADAKRKKAKRKNLKRNNSKQDESNKNEEDTTMKTNKRVVFSKTWISPQADLCTSASVAVNALSKGMHLGALVAISSGLSSELAVHLSTLVVAAQNDMLVVDDTTGSNVSEMDDMSREMGSLSDSIGKLKVQAAA